MAPPARRPSPAAAPASGARPSASPPPEISTDGRSITSERPPKGPESGGEQITLNFVDIDLLTLLERFADWKRMNFILGDKKDLEGKKVSIISHHPVSVDAAYEAFLSAMRVHGFTLVETNGMVRVVKASDAGKNPIAFGRGAPGSSEQVMTRLIQLENVDVSDVSKIATEMVSDGAKVTAWVPTNTLIITDTANNIRKIDGLLRELDVASPTSTMAFYPLEYAEATNIKTILEELYAVEAKSSKPEPKTRSSRRSSRSKKTTPEPIEASQLGEQSNYISKVLDDERTNSLIVLANEEGHMAVVKLIAELDVDVDPATSSQIHVVYLEHAKAEDVASVLSELSQSGSQSTTRKNNQSLGSSSRTKALAAAAAAKNAKDAGEGRGAIAAFDSGMRISADENTNSLVIIANREDFQIVRSVIAKLDVRRNQVLVDAVILEVGSDDELEMGLAAHLPLAPSDNTMGLIGSQLNTNSLAITEDMLSGLAAGVFGEQVEVPFGVGGTTMMVPVPAFGIVLQAMKANSAINIISNPNLMTLDNEEAKFIVGRKVPFPTQSGISQFGQSMQTFQREDVAITLEVTPRINSGNFVTLELRLEVSEIEEDSSGLSGAVAVGGGPVTSKREVETVVLVRDNQMVVIGGLVSVTDTEVESKVPVLGDIPLIGSLFRASRTSSRKTNLMIFLTPHIIDDDEDLWEIQRVKEAQRQEFMRRFYGKSRDEFQEQLRDLLRYSMNEVDKPSYFRGSANVEADLTLDGEVISVDSRQAVADVVDSSSLRDMPGAGAGELPEDLNVVILESDETGADMEPVPEEPPVVTEEAS
jgi:general secretion pathway protein D